MRVPGVVLCKGLSPNRPKAGEHGEQEIRSPTMTAGPVGLAEDRRSGMGCGFCLKKTL